MKRNCLSTFSRVQQTERLLYHILPPRVFSRNFNSTALQTHADDSTVATASANDPIEHSQRNVRRNNSRTMACLLKAQQKHNLKKSLNHSSVTRKIDAECQSQLQQVRACQNEKQLLSLFEQMHTHSSDTDETTTTLLPYDVYTEFLTRASQIGPGKCNYWNIFDGVKELLLAASDDYHPMLIGQVYSHAMATTMDYHHDKRAGSYRVLQLWWKLKDLCNDDSNHWGKNLAFHPLIVNRVISLCLDAFSYKRCKAVIDEVLENEIPFTGFDRASPNFRLKQLILCNSILNYFCKVGETENMEAFYEKMIAKYGIDPDSVTFNIRINAYVRTRSDEFENVFKEYIERFRRYPECDAFSALINGYASKSDFAACIDVLRLLRSKNTPSGDTGGTDAMKQTLPQINLTAFIPIFRALCRSETPLNAQNGWKLVEYLLNLMESANLVPNETVYQHLFSLSGTSYFDTPDMEKLMFYYKEMTETRGLKPYHCQLRNALLSAIQYFEFQEQQPQSEQNILNFKKEKYEFVQWWKSETVKYGVEINQELHKILTRHFK